MVRVGHRQIFDILDQIVSSGNLVILKLPCLVSGRRRLLRQPRAEDAHRGDEHAVPPLKVLLVDGLLPRDERLVARADCRGMVEMVGHMLRDSTSWLPSSKW